MVVEDITIKDGIGKRVGARFELIPKKPDGNDAPWDLWETSKPAGAVKESKGDWALYNETPTKRHVHDILVEFSFDPSHSAQDLEREAENERCILIIHLNSATEDMKNSNIIWRFRKVKSGLNSDQYKDGLKMYFDHQDKKQDITTHLSNQGTILTIEIHDYEKGQGMHEEILYQFITERVDKSKLDFQHYTPDAIDSPDPSIVISRRSI